jgi:hypothetical protein
MLIAVNNGVAAETVLLRSVLPVDPVRLMLVLPPDTRLSLRELAACRSGVRDVGQASGR